MTSGDRRIEVVVSDGMFESAAESMLLTLPVASESTPPIAVVDNPISEPDAPGSGGGSLATQYPMSTDAENAAEDVTETSTEIDIKAETEADIKAEVDAALEQATQPTDDQAEELQPRDNQERILAGNSQSPGTGSGGGQKINGALVKQSINVNEPLEVASIASAELWEEIASMRAQMAAEEALAADDPRQIAYTAAKTMTVFLFAGATNWYLKGSALLASLFSSLPLWTPFDPLPILALNRRMRRRRERTQATAAALELRYSAGMTRLLDARTVQTSA